MSLVNPDIIIAIDLFENKSNNTLSQDKEILYLRQALAIATSALKQVDFSSKSFNFKIKGTDNDNAISTTSA